MARLAFTRIGDNIRQGIFRLVTSRRTGAPALYFERPVVNGGSPEDYTMSLVLRDRVAARRETMSRAQGLRIGLRGLGARQVLHVTLVEEDGTSWSAPLVVDSTWKERFIPLADLRIARAANLPLGYPGQWNYWTGRAEGRGASGDRLRPEKIERLQLSLRPVAGARAGLGSYGVEIESVTLMFRPAGGTPPSQ